MKDEQNVYENKIIGEDNINLVELFYAVWNGRKLIVIVSSVCFVIGLIFSFLVRKEYESYSKLLPENSESKNNYGGLGSLAGLAGLSVELGSSEMLDPQLYPEIVYSVPFQKGLINEPIYYSSLDTIISFKTFQNEYKEESFLESFQKFTIGLPNLVKSKLANNRKENSVNYLGKESFISREDLQIINELRRNVQINISNGVNIIIVKTVMSDPHAAANLNEVVVSDLKAFLIEYKTQKAKQNLEFVEKSFIEAERDYYKKLDELGQFRDRNLNISSVYAQSEFQRLQNEMNISLEVYKGLASQREQAKIQMTKEMPLFTVLEPSLIPYEKSKPRRALIVFLFTLISFVLSLCFVLAKKIVLDYIKSQ